jgi:hypothetical protein
MGGSIFAALLLVMNMYQSPLSLCVLLPPLNLPILSLLSTPTPYLPLNRKQHIHPRLLPFLIPLFLLHFLPTLNLNLNTIITIPVSASITCRGRESVLFVALYHTVSSTCSHG